MTKKEKAPAKEPKEKLPGWELFINFLGNVIAIVLGVVITFMIQGRIDRASELKEVRSALELVRTELVTNREDIRTMEEYLEQERRAAIYYLDNFANLRKCPTDSLMYHGGILHAHVSITLSHDALELLKMSSLFQKIGDNPLSMKIIRAYDSCTYIAADLNRHISVRDARYTGEITREYVLPLATMANMDLLTDVTDLETAITAIDDYLKKR